ncbi:MAG: transglutaminase family protein [Planctomycetia bacterium]|nr:transglutaminase family protein [Planctomycetia bacterium]
MKYKVSHTTRYLYTEAVPICHNQVRLGPRGTQRQHCLDHRLWIDPAPAERSHRMDYFGNRVEYFSVHEPHKGLTVTSISHVTVTGATNPTPGPGAAWELVVSGLATDCSRAGLDAYQYTFDSHRVRTSPTLAEYAAESFASGRDVVDAARDLTTRLHRDFTYDAKATTVHTPLEEVFRHRRGVCQDFAHIQIACLRSLGLAARYVSGYVRTEPPPGKARLVGADMSHAWASVYAGELGWIDFDPTNDQLVGTNHVTVAWGRDYSDVCPIQGVIIGGGHHSVSVAVDVVPL